MDPYDLIPWIAGISGACVGSFLSVVIYRIPREGMSVLVPMRSFCPGCNYRLAWFDNIPILSWLLLGGRCRNCRTRIPLRYPFLELVTAAIFVLVALRFIAPPLAETLPLAIVWASLLAALLAVTYVDIDHRIIPDEISVNGMSLALPAALCLRGVPVDPLQPAWFARVIDKLRPDATAVPYPDWALLLAAFPCAALGMYLFRRFSPSWEGSVRTWWETRLAGVVAAALAFVLLGCLFGDRARSSPLDPEALAASLFGMGTGAGVIYAIGVVGKWAFRKPAMGFGDVKLMGLLGAVLGWKGVLLAILLACLLGSLVGLVLRIVTRSSYIPFGPFLSAGGAVLVLWDRQVLALVDWYLEFSRRGDPMILVSVSLGLSALLILLLWFSRRFQGS